METYSTGPVVTGPVVTGPTVTQSVRLNILSKPSSTFGNDVHPDERDFYTGANGTGYTPVSRIDRSILSDLKNYPFSDDIKITADLIFNMMHYRVRRGKKRQQLIFYCVYCAHLEFGIDVNPIQLGATFGLKHGEVQRCDSLFSPLQTGYRPKSTLTSPLKYLPDYCQQMDLTQEAVDDITQMALDILKKEPELYQENPQTVAAGILKYYTETHGIVSDDPQKLMKVTGRTNVTIDGIYKRIATIDNR